MADQLGLRVAKAGALLAGWGYSNWRDPWARGLVRVTDPQHGSKREPLETDHRDCRERSLPHDAQSLIFANGAGVRRNCGDTHELVDPDPNTGLRLVPPEVGDLAGGGLPRAQIWQDLSGVQVAGAALAVKNVISWAISLLALEALLQASAS